MVRNVQEEMKREISESSWLDESAKSVARKKIDAMTNSVGYPDWYDVPGKLDEYYREVRDHSFIHSRQLNFDRINGKRISAHSWTRLFRKLSRFL